MPIAIVMTARMMSDLNADCHCNARIRIKPSSSAESIVTDWYMDFSGRLVACLYPSRGSSIWCTRCTWTFRSILLGRLCHPGTPLYHLDSFVFTSAIRVCGGTEMIPHVVLLSYGESEYLRM